jgi:hypothetical protein
MNTIDDDVLLACETHNPARLQALLERGLDASTTLQGLPLVVHLIEMYLRSDRFVPCLRLLLDHGAALPDPLLAPVLLDDPVAIRSAAQADPAWLKHRASMRSTFTPLDGATLLHVAAEYGHLAAVDTLLELGVDVDAPAAFDADGMNGHTPLFHTVNSHENRSAPVMRRLLAAGADPQRRLNGITWGRGFDWETTCLDVTPIAYAQLGLLPQMQRTEADCYANVAELLRAARRTLPALRNVPNRYLATP